MKKSLVFLLILAVAGGIFAQEGSFSWSGAVDFNAKMDLIPDDPEVYLVNDANTGATVDLAYTLGGLELGMGFTAKVVDADDNVINKGAIGLKAGYTGDNFGLHAEMDLFTTQYGTGGDTTFTATFGSQILSFGPTSLWGYYTFLNGDLRFDASYNGGGNGVWAVSDIVKDENWGDWDRLDAGAGGLQFTYTGIDSLSFGIIFPFYGINGNPAGAPGDYTYGFFENVFKNITLGAAFDNGSLGVSFMAALQNYSDFTVDFALGFYYQINDAMKVNFDTAMRFGLYTGVSIGLGFSYDASPLNIGLTIKAIDLTDEGLSDSFGGMALEFAPTVSFAFSDFLSAHLNITFDVGLGDGTATEKMLELEFAPGLDFTIAPNATFGLGYCVRLGLGDAYSDTLVDHNITLAFHWAF